MASPTGGGNGKDQILEDGNALLKDFIFERVRRHGDSNAVVTRAQLGGGELRDPNHEKLAKCLEAIGNELDGNEELQRMINDLKLNAKGESFIQIAIENWIREQGGWERICSHFGTSTWQTLGVFLAGVLTTFLVTKED
ncbi:apoptosis regulator BAX-like isoform X2 [Centroberyx affinis]|uniref:apoptosis regulator BAX-like isoform X2 n=1 Tax=Centroberyx affinis TaxID=166261 RepID=UPI003A5BCEFD